jgi:hypothetical protein
LVYNEGTKVIIFVFIEDGSVEIVSDIDEVRKNCEGIDVESSVFRFLMRTDMSLRSFLSSYFSN